MADFKVDKSIATEIETMKAKGKAINHEYEAPSKEGVEKLSTAKKYIKQQKEIKQLLDEYKKLVIRDAEDLHWMVATATEMDEKLAASYKD